MVVKKKMKTHKTIKQQKWLDKTIETGNATEAAAQVYNCKSRKVAKAIGAENLSKPILKAEIEDRLAVAKNIIYGIATEETEKADTRLRACQDIIDRVEGKPTQKIVSENVVKVIDENTPMEELLKLVKK